MLFRTLESKWFRLSRTTLSMWDCGCDFRATRHEEGDVTFEDQLVQEGCLYRERWYRLKMLSIELERGRWCGAKHLAFSVTRRCHRSDTVSSIEGWFDFQHCIMQNVSLLKGDMFNVNACYVGFVDWVQNDDTHSRVGVGVAVAPIEERFNKSIGWDGLDISNGDLQRQWCVAGY